MKQITLCITGGHLTPALAVIEEIMRQNSNWNLLFIGRSHAFEGGGSPTQEERLIRAFGIPFHALFTGRQGPSLWKFPIGLFQSFFLLASHRPTAVLSFGGYIALPVAIGAWILRIPIITHEQTGGLGLANKIIARLAWRVIFSSESGMPLRRALFNPPEKPSFTVDTKPPILYVTGGSTGAASLNALVYPLIAELTKTYTVIHQVGSGGVSEALRVQESLSLEAKRRYVISDYFDESNLAWIYRHCSLLVGRSGANTVAEVAALGVPALFIPLPWSAGNEQMNNARRLVKEGMAVVMKQKKLASGILIRQIDEIMQTISQLRKAAGTVAKMYPHSGAEKVVTSIRSMLS